MILVTLHAHNVVSTAVQRLQVLLAFYYLKFLYFFIYFLFIPYLLQNRIIDGFDVLDDLEKLQVNEKNFRPHDKVYINDVQIHANPLADD